MNSWRKTSEEILQQLLTLFRQRTGENSKLFIHFITELA